jgi:hypothetical protein
MIQTSCSFVVPRSATREDLQTISIPISGPTFNSEAMDANVFGFMMMVHLPDIGRGLTQLQYCAPSLSFRAPGYLQKQPVPIEVEDCLLS